MQMIKDTIIKLGAHYVAEVDIKEVVFSKELLDMCKMNTCGNYNTNWGCPPGAKDMEKTKEELLLYKNILVYQRVENIEDSFDYEGMVRSAEEFSKLTMAIKDFLAQEHSKFKVLGAGGCNYCEKCTFPDKPCAFPEKQNTSVEAYGIYVSNLCEKAGLDYIHGANTVTNTGLIAY